MGIENIPSEGWLWFFVVLLLLVNVYNAVSTARKNVRDEKKRHDQPTAELNSKIGDISKKLDSDKRRLDDHDKRLDDLRKGLMVNCAGVQALLEHELHNGNTTEMETASTDIDKWLRERP